MTEVNYNGKEELLMADYEGISDSDLTGKYANTDFDITDAPSTYITNTQMTYALTCRRLFPAGDTYICNDEGTYKKGHTYTIKVVGETKSWEDVTPTPTIDDTPTATSNNPVKSSGIYTAIQGKQDKLTAGTNITIDENNVISASGGTQNAVTLETETQTFKGSKRLKLPLFTSLMISNINNDNKVIELNPYDVNYNQRIIIRSNVNSFLAFGITSSKATISIGLQTTGITVVIPEKSGTLALTSDIDAKVPNAPDTDGTYTLKCVVSNGVKTYQWVLDA